MEIKHGTKKKQIYFILALAVLLFSSFTSASNYCFQEEANISSSCGGLRTGSYRFADCGGLRNWGWGFDSNWSSFMYTVGSICPYDHYINYTIPSMALSSSIFQKKGTDSSGNANITNYTIPIQCWKSPLEMRVSAYYQSSFMSWQNTSCSNSTAWFQIDYHNKSSTQSLTNLYEEAMWWDMAITSQLNNPLNSTSKATPILFNCSGTSRDSNLTNITIFLWNSTDDLVNNSISYVSGTLAEATFNISFDSEDTFKWNCWVVNNQSNQTFHFENYTFNLVINPPNITLNYPLNNSFLNFKNNVYFNYTAIDTFSLDSCNLYSNFNGSWGLNYTWTNPNNNEMNYTIINLTDGVYIWNVLCNNSINKLNFSEFNYTITIDTTLPTLNISQIATTQGSQSVTFSSNVTDTNLDSCWYVVYNSSGGVDGLLSNVSFNCSENATFVVSAYQSFNLTIYANDSATNENSTTQQFTTTAQISISGGGGGSLSKIPVIGLQDINSTTLAIGTPSYTGLQREIIYAEFYNLCQQKDSSNKCTFSAGELNEIVLRLKDKDIEITYQGLFKFYESFQANKLFQGSETKETIEKYGLVQAILGELVSLQITPPSIDSPYIIYKTDDGEKIITATLTSNKKLQSCEVLTDGNNIDCNVSGNTIKITLRIDRTDFISKIFSHSINVVTDAPVDKMESKKVLLTFRVYNLGHRVYGIPYAFIFGFVVLGILSLGYFIFASKRFKYTKNFKNVFKK